MKLLHIADLHLGKKLDQYFILEEQQENLRQVTDYIIQEHVDVLLISGDIFDKKNPKGQAIDVYRQFIETITQYCEVYAIAGNHDNFYFHQFASSLLSKSHYHVIGQLDHEIVQLEWKKNNEKLVLSLCPYMDLPMLREVLCDESIQEENEGMEKLLSYVEVDEQAINVLLYHGYVTGKQELIFSDSERINTLGTSQAVDVNLFSKFDYVALGHLHRYQQVEDSNCYYSGSLYWYSESELHHEKGMIEITWTGNQKEVTFIPFQPSHRVRKISGSCEELLQMPETEDYIYAEVIGRDRPLKFHQQLKERCPHLIQISQIQEEENFLLKDQHFDFDNSIEEQIKQYYELIYDEPMTQEEENILHELMKESD